MTTVGSGPDFPEFKATSGALAAHAAVHHGDHTLAVRGDQRLSFRDADERSRRLARGLLATGVGKGTRIGLLGPNGPDWIVGWLAASRIGAVVVLLNTYYRERELRWALRHADVQVLLTVDHHLGHDYLDRLEAIAPGLAGASARSIMVPSHPYLRAVWAWGQSGRSWAEPMDDLLAHGDAVTEELLDEVESEVVPADPMVVVYSSGSTSDPKGAVHSHGATIRHAHNLWRYRELTSSDVLYSPMPLFWVGGLSFTLVAAIHAGATLVFEDRFEAGETLAVIERERVTQVVGWPHVIKALVEHPSRAGRDLSSIRGGPLSPEAAPGKEGQPVTLRASSLGMTETLGPHTFDDARSELPPSKVGSFGRSIPGAEHRVVDPRTGERSVTGEMGELWVRGYSLMLGLHKRERDEVFTADGWYRTGDGGYFDEDGHFYFKGRLGNQIKSSGMNITPREVELVLEEHPEVTMAFVTGVDHADRGQDVVAAVVVSPGTPCDAEAMAALRGRLKHDMASYKVPRHIEPFATLEELPWLDSGKPDIRALTALLTERYEAM